MLPSWLCAVLLLAVIAIVLVLILFFGAWCRRLSRRVRLLEAAARRACAERIAIPEPIVDPALESTLPRFIGSPYPTRRAP